jgi:hypothetical protein
MSEWIEWDGSNLAFDDAPCAPEVEVEIKCRNGETSIGIADDFYWRDDGDHCDIVAYKLREPVIGESKDAKQQKLGPFKFTDTYVSSRVDLSQPVNQTLRSEEHTGLSVSYYTTHIDAPTSGGEPYDAECNDIIEALNMTYAEANVFKAIWRIAASRQGKLKKGNNTVYDAEKAVFFSARVLVKEKKNA